MEKIYCIRSANGMYWDNEFGWIELENEQDEATFSIFSEEEMKKYHLPVGDGAYWEELV
jgi:hypothetical protein